jgi:molybdopterin-biosynthesis enzyme MoeA-like protein
MITETQDRKIGTLHDLAQDNELTPRRSVDAPQSHVARIGTLRDLAQDIKSTFDLKPGVPESIDDYELTEQSLKPAELPRRSESIDTPENLSAGLPKPHSSVDASFVPGADIELLLDTIRKEIESEYKRYYGES